MKESRKTRYTKMILQNSLFELLEQKPISKITIKELCENADINRTTFYAHYTDQYDLLTKIENETLDWAKEAVANLTDKNDRYENIKIIEEIFQYIVDNGRNLKILMSERGDINFQKQIFTIIYQQCGIYFSSDASSNIRDEYFIFVINGSIGLLQHWLKNGMNRSAKEMAEIIYNMAVQSDNLREKTL
ncbi:TetR-like C-terminal domain-containing protein [Sedimentibacter sp.]|uniref:TetR/AcrR family transcriptional regulator n=1 Tax=Sedimentibacter sp. TaxID=1960295 RepID=UPI002897E96B|nr:TetR-like C-terminal domain-containing protein [Sedimentibacter sp.]